MLVGAVPPSVGVHSPGASGARSRPGSTDATSHVAVGRVAVLERPHEPAQRLIVRVGGRGVCGAERGGQRHEDGRGDRPGLRQRPFAGDDRDERRNHHQTGGAQHCRIDEERRDDRQPAHDGDDEARQLARLAQPHRSRRHRARPATRCERAGRCSAAPATAAVPALNSGTIHRYAADGAYHRQAAASAIQIGSATLHVSAGCRAGWLRAGSQRPGSGHAPADREAGDDQQEQQPPRSRVPRVIDLTGESQQPGGGTAIAIGHQQPAEPAPGDGEDPSQHAVRSHGVAAHPHPRDDAGDQRQRRDDPVHGRAVS